VKALLLLIPIEATPLLIVLAGLALIVGARAWAGGLLAFALALVALPALLAPFLEQLPAGLLWLVILLLGLGLALALFRGLSTSLIGERATSYMLGELAAGFVRACVSMPFRAVWWLVRLTWRGLRRRP
jgi:hypothetical protein